METSILLIATITVCAYLYYIISNKMSHFVRLKVPHAKPIPFLGNMAPFFFQRLTLPENIHQLYNRFPNAKYIGSYDFMRPVYVIRDPELVKSIAIKNFDHFCDHPIFISNDVDSFASRNLFDLRGDEWREMRKLLSPSFSSGKMKLMFELIYECANNLTSFVSSQSETSGKVYDMKDMFNRHTYINDEVYDMKDMFNRQTYINDVIATCLFGISVNSFKQPNNKFLYFVKDMVDMDKNAFIIQLIRRFPILSKLSQFKTFDQRIEKFLGELITNTVKVRDEQGISRPDLIQIMMETKYNKRALDIDEMAAQAFTFFGNDTVSATLSFLSYEIGINPDVQNKLKAEIDDVISRHGKPSYEVINSMKYLDAVVKECLRLYPLLDLIDRRCVKEFELPPAMQDGKPVILKPGDNIWFSSFSVHRDAKYFAEPEKFGPERFLNGQIYKSAYFPFGLGPRMCIAYRLALMVMKILYFCLLWRYDIEPVAKTIFPLVLDKKSFLMAAEGGFWSKLRPR